MRDIYALHMPSAYVWRLQEAGFSLRQQSWHPLVSQSSDLDFLYEKQNLLRIIFLQ